MSCLTDWREIKDPEEKRHAYHASREWGLKREAVFTRCHGLCERCQRHPAEGVHHLTYRRLYNERLEDLQGICHRCHDFIHGRSSVDPKKMRERTPAENAQEISILIKAQDDARRRTAEYERSHP